MAMTATTIINSIRVKPARRRKHFCMVIPPSGCSIGRHRGRLNCFSTNGVWRPMIGCILGIQGLGMAYSSAGGGVSLPDFRNFGVLIRVLVLAELMNGLALLAHARSLPEAGAQVGEWAPLFEVVLLVVLGVLAAVAPVLGRLPYRRGA